MIKLTDILNEDCWKGYKQVGGKMKNGKMVPNCVPESVQSVNERYRPNLNSKGYEAAQKVIRQLQSSVFRKLNDDELLEFRKAIADAFNLDGVLKENTVDNHNDSSVPYGSGYEKMEEELSSKDRTLIYKLTTMALKAMPKSQKQKEIIKKLNFVRTKNGMKPLSEEVLNEDLRKWFGKGKTGSSSGGGWDRYGTDGQKLGKCGDGEDGDAYAACLSKEKAAKLGPKGRAAFVKRKRADQKKAGDTKKGGNRKKGKTPTFSKTGA